MSRPTAESAGVQSVGSEPVDVESLGIETVDAGRLADLIAVAVTACPDVARLSAGPVATYLPGRSVPGVAVRDEEVRVAVVARYGRPLAEVAEQVRAAVAPLVPPRRVDVTIDDLAIGDEEREDGEGRGPGVV